MCLTRYCKLPVIKIVKMKASNFNERRRFVKNGSIILGGIMLSPLLTTLLPNSITKRVFAASNSIKPKNTDGDWRSNLKIIDSKELTKKQLNEFMSKDVINALDYKELNISLNSDFINSEKVQAVHHSLENNNTLLAISVQSEYYVVIYYSLNKPINHFKSGSYLLYVDEEEQEVHQVDQLINGKPALETNLQSSCGNCIIQNFTYGSGSACSKWDLKCLVQCCGPCSLMCKTLAACLPCLALWCPICNGATCCTRYSSTCYSCA